MKRFLPVLLVLLLVPLAVAAQSVCYDCHANHGNIWLGAQDFHAHGVGNCQMCHTMHNSQDGWSETSGSRPFLLKGDTASDVCLSCHSGSYSNVFGSDPQNPPREVGAGNFVFLLEENVNDAPNGEAVPILGSACGHNIIAPSRGADADPIHTTAPGGDFPSDQLGCTSCHDPHGNANYRMLYGAGMVQIDLYEFTAPAPEADGLSVYHGNEGITRHTAYHSGMSAWCGNCHGDFHVDDGTHKHVTDAVLGEAVSDRYNAYNGSDDPTGGHYDLAYTPQVPFENPGASLYSSAGASSSSRIMCLTCHRAHASASPDALRWDPNVTFLSQDGVVSGSYAQPSPYAHPAQRSLCNKCHGKDEYDRLTLP